VISSLVPLVEKLVCQVSRSSNHQDMVLCFRYVVMNTRFIIVELADANFRY
jgi:hypothetical protein